MEEFKGWILFGEDPARERRLFSSFNGERVSFFEGNSTRMGVDVSNLWISCLTLDSDGWGGLPFTEPFTLELVGAEEDGAGMAAASPDLGYWGSFDLEMKAFWRVSRLRPPVFAGEKPTLNAMLSRRGS